MKAFTFGLLGSVVLLWASCRLVSTSQLHQMGQQIEFGSGGGFTGQTTHYSLTSDGRLSVRQGINGAEQAIRQLKKKEVRQLFRKVASLRLDTLNFNHPGNQYYFIHWHSLPQAYKVTWGNEKIPVPVPVQQVYQQLLTTTHN